MNANPFDNIDDRLDRLEDILKNLKSIIQSEPTTCLETFLDTEQLCEMFNVTRQTIWTWDKKGLLNPVKVGNLKRYRLSDLKSLTGKSCLVKVGPEPDSNLD